LATVVDVGRVVKPGESVLVPLRWNNPHASEMEVNIWIFEHAEKHPIVVPIRKPSCSGEGHQDNIVSFTVPKDFDTLGAKIPGFKGCNEDSKPKCALQIYSHSVESRTYAIGFPIVIPGHKSAPEPDVVISPVIPNIDTPCDANNYDTVASVSEDPWYELGGLRDICLPATDPSATITTAVPRWARLVSDVYNHAYQNSDYSPYSGQQQESISKNLQASAVNKMELYQDDGVGQVVTVILVYAGCSLLLAALAVRLWPQKEWVNPFAAKRRRKVPSDQGVRLGEDSYIPSDTDVATRI